MTAIAVFIAFALNAQTQNSPATPNVGRKFLSGHVAKAWENIPQLGRLAGTNQMRLAVSLPLRNTNELGVLLAQIYDPASTNYHHYLMPQEFTERFGPTAQQYQVVEDFAKANGFNVVGRFDNRAVLDIEGSVSDVERAFRVALHEYRHPGENRKFFAPDVDPTVDVALPILHVSGLNNYSIPRPRYTKRAASDIAPRANNGSGPSNNYMGSDFRHAYVPGSPLTGTGQIVGLLQFDGYSAADIAYYYTKAGITPITLTNVLIGGATGAASGNGGEVEVCLDIEMVASMAPGLSKIMLFIAPNTDTPDYWPDLLNAMVAHPEVKQFSCSWGNSSPGAEPGAESALIQMQAQGQTFFNATGDSDAFSSSNPITFPSESTNVVEVGATTLSMNGTGASYLSETVWQWGGNVGSSGGASASIPIPPWQQGISMTASQGSTTKRNVPDVAACGDNVYVRADAADQTGTGGTSCAAPLWAGYTALVNQQAAANGQPPVGFLNPALYAIGKSASFTSAFHDITTGYNTNSSSKTKYFAVTGFDLCTGWGTPTGTNLINLLAPAVAGPAAILASPTSLTNAYGTTATFNVTADGAAPLAYQWYFTNAISGATNASLIITNVAVTNAGNYFVIVTNFSGSATSAVASLTVITTPVITLSPVSLTNLYGATTTFTSAAIGAAPLAYQWYFTNAINGATNSSLIISNTTATNGGNYFVIVTNSFGSATSAVAALTVISTPTIAQSPASQSVLIGQPASFNVTAFGAPPLTYQWRKEGTNLNGATLTNYLIASAAATDAGNYDVVVTNNSGSVTSSVAVLTTLNPAAYIGVLAGWDMSGQSSFGTSPFAPTTNASNVTVTGLARGSGVGASGTAAARGWGGTTFNSTSEATAIAASQFATCALASASGYAVSFSSVSKFYYRRSSGGPPSGVLQYQVGGGAFTDVASLSYSSSASSGASIGAIDLSGVGALQNIPAGTTVTFRVVNYGATSSGGTWYLYDSANTTDTDFEISGSLSPVTAATTPIVVTGSATSINTNSATLNATVNPNNQSTTAQFFYGPTTSYGSIAPVSGPLTGGTAQAVNAAITGLAPNTTYHFTITATNNSGSVTGLDQTFTTTAISSGGGISYGGVLAGWEVNGLSGYGASPFGATTNAPIVTIVGLTRGSGVGTANTAAANAWGGTGFVYANEAAAISGNSFATFNITANSGYTISFTNIPAYNIRHSGSGSTTGIWQYQVGAGAFIDIGSAINWGSNTGSSGNAESAVDLSVISALQNIAPGIAVTFRIVLWGGTGTGSWYVNNQTGNDLQVLGTLTPLVANTAPSITVQPFATNVFVGKNAGFNVIATGTAPLAYQWLKNGSTVTDGGAISGTLTNVLSFTPAATNHAGGYSVIVTNLGGAVTSSVALLNVAPLPVLTFFNSGAGWMIGADGGAVSNTIIIQSATNLMPPIVWLPLQTNVIGTNGQIRFAGTNYNTPASFYRIQIP